MKPFIISLFFFCASALAQIGSSTASHIRWGPSLPATCRPGTGDVFFKTTATVGPNYCSATNTWTAITGAGGGGGTPGAPDTSVQFRTNSTTFGGDALFEWDNTAKQLKVGLLGSDPSFDANIQSWFPPGTINSGAVATTAPGYSGSSGMTIFQQDDGYAKGIAIMVLSTDTRGDDAGGGANGLNIDAFINTAVDSSMKAVAVNAAWASLGIGRIAEAVNFLAGGDAWGNTSPITLAAGLHVNGLGRTGIDTAVGVLVDDQTGASINKAFQSGLGLVEFGDTVLNVPVAFINLGTMANGSWRSCSDCQVTSGADNTCAAGGSGAAVFVINGVKRCFATQN